jgi:uncharacterized iron-regulated membrane protein
MNAARVSRLGHRWLALIVGLQLLVWAASGLYMVAVDIDVIHGDALVRNVAPPVRIDATLAPLEPIVQARPDVVEVRLRTLPDRDQTVWELVRANGSELVDAGTGEPVGRIDAVRARALAEAYYAGRGTLARLDLLTDDASLPGEIRGRHAPLWRAEFDDWLQTTLYVRADTGRLETRRHRLWRWFDLLWSLHIMDYGTRENVGNPLLRVAAPLALVTALAGLWLAFFSFPFLRRRGGRRGDPK